MGQSTGMKQSWPSFSIRT